MIDTHCHLTYDGLHERVDEVLAAARAAGVDRMIVVGTTPEDAAKAVALAEKHDELYATVGLHPHYAEAGPAGDETLQATLAAMRELTKRPKVVAVGEMGLDWHYPDPPADVQRQAFGKQLEVAAGLGDDALPIIIHNRKATNDVLAMIRESGIPGQRFVFHCFTGDSSEIDKILAIGAMVSFTGIVTFNSARDVAEASDRVPMERLMVETDSPYLTPEPHRKVRPNEPRYVVEVARFLAARRGMSFDDFVETVDANADRFFRLK